MTSDKRILIHNIYYMLSYAFSSLKQDIYQDVATEKFEQMYDMYAAILSKGIGVQLKRGLYRSYTTHTDVLSGVRGKINLSQTMNECFKRTQKVVCEFDELSENNLLNQIIKTTALLLLKKANVRTKFKTALRQKLAYFSEVDAIDLMRIPWSTLSFQKNNQTYQMLIGICRLVIDGMLLTTRKGEYRLASFIDEQTMSRLYEKFILSYYARHYPKLHPRAYQIDWSLDGGMNTALPVMQTDIFLQKDNCELIIDAKYYHQTMQVHFDKQTLHSNHLYQIFTYVKNRDYALNDKDVHVSGMLLYAKTEEAIQPDYVYQMHGNQISVKTLDLNVDFQSIKNQLDEIVKEHFGDGLRVA